MAFVNDYKVELLYRYVWSIINRYCLGLAQFLIQPAVLFQTAFFCALFQFLSFKNRIQALYGRNTYLCIRSDVTGREPLDIVEFGKLPIVIVRLKRHKLLLSLLTKVFSIYKKQDTLCIGVF